MGLRLGREGRHADPAAAARRLARLLLLLLLHARPLASAHFRFCARSA